MTDPTQSGLYEFIEPGRPVELFSGPARIGGEDTAIRVWMPMSRDAGVRWSLDGGRSVDLDESVLTIQHSIYGSVEVAVSVLHSDGFGTVRTTELGDGAALSKVVVHWINLPQFTTRTWNVEAAGWRVSFLQRSDYSSIFRGSGLDEQFALTHVGILCREDGSDFDMADVAELLHSLQLGMSVALGRWVAPALPVGLDGRGDRVWERWAPWRCNHRRGYESWWDPVRTDDLRSFLSLFLERQLESDESKLLRHFVMHLIAANHSSTTAEGKVMLGQAGIEFWAWVRLALLGPLSPKGFEDLSAADRLRLLLDQAAIPVEVPEGLPGLYDLARQREMDGPEATVWVRNRAVHPKNPTQIYEIKNLIWESAQLLLGYGELLLLWSLRYDSRYMPRYPPGRWVGSGVYVPWAEVPEVS